MSSLRWAWGLASLALVACGGSGSDSESNVSQPKDTQAPVITLQGSSDQVVPYASLYEDAGATAEDNVDGAVIVTVSGDVDTEVAGDYTITYTARDAAGNTATAERRVTVEAEKVLLTLSLFGEGQHTLSNLAEWSCRSDGRICQTQVSSGETVSVTASPGTGWTFESWMGCDEVAGSVCTITAIQDRVIYSFFADNEPVELWPDVVVLTDAQINSISTSSAGSNVIVFAAGADLGDVKIGSVIVSNGTESNPIYFAKRVRDIVQLSGSPAYIEAVDVPLTDIIKSGTISIEPDFPAPSTTQSTGGPGSLKGALATNISPLSGPGENDQVVTLKFEALEVSLSDDVSLILEGSVDLILSRPRFDIHIGDGLEYFSLVTQFGVHGNIGPKFEFSGLGTPVNVEGDFPAGPPIPVPPVQAGPVTVITEIQPLIMYEAKLEASIQASFDVDAHATFGYIWTKNHDGELLQEFDPQWGASWNETSEAGFRASAGPGIRPSFKFYGVVGPYAEAKLYAGGEGTVTPLQNCKYNLRSFAGGKVGFGGAVDLIWERMSFKALTFTKELTLKQQDYACDAATTDITPPEPVSRPSLVALSSSSIQVSWEEPEDEVGVLQYAVWRTEANESVFRRIGFTSKTEFEDVGLGEQSEYCYFIVAEDFAGNQSAHNGNSSCATTPPSRYIQSPPSPMIVNTEAISSTAILIEWDDTANSEENIRYSVYDVGADLSTEYLVAGGSEKSAYVTQLNPETEYCFQVFASDIYGNTSAGSDVRCESTLSDAAADWMMFIGCQGREWRIEQPLDLDEEISSVIEVVGNGFDYDGGALTYALLGAYESVNSQLQAEIRWSFENSGNERLDRFLADLSGGDSGVVLMDQVQVTGCDAQIRFVRSEGSSVVAGSENVAASIREPLKVEVDGPGRNFFELN